MGNESVRKELLQELLLSKQHALIVVDVETVSLDDRTPIGVGIAVSPTDAFYFPIDSTELPWDILRNATTDKIFHNSLFDVSALYSYSIDTTNIEDTLTMAHLLNKHPKLIYLTNMLGVVGNLNLTTVEEILPKHKNSTMLDVDVSIVAQHCCNDALATYRVYNILYNSIVSSNMLAYYKDEVALLPLLISMEKRGLRIDHTVRDKFEQEYEESVSFLKRQCEAIGFNPGSNQQVAYMLALKHVRLPMTKSKKNLKVDKDILSSIAEPEAALTLAYRHARKMLSTYIKPLSGQERFYYKFHVDTVTGRLGSYDRNVQNIPPDLRAMFPGPFTDLDYCLAPSTKVLTWDLRWVAVEDVVVGDILVGIDEYAVASRGMRRKIRKAVVQRTTNVTQPSYMIILENGQTIYAGALHKWLRAEKYKKLEWVTTEQLIPGMALRYFVEPWEEDRSYEAGWLAGFLDGEGYIDKHFNLGFGQNHGTLLSQASDMLTHRGCHLNSLPNSKSSCVRVVIPNMSDSMRIIGTTRPRRMLEKVDFLDGLEPPHWKLSGRTVRIRVKDVIPVGNMELIGLQTSTGTFIAEGLFSHNSQIELRLLAYFSGDKVMLNQFRKFDASHDKKDSIHQQTAELLGIEYRRAKNTNFSITYGASVRTVAKTAGVSLRQAAMMLHTLLDNWKEAALWMKQQKQFAMENGYVITLLGRKLYMPPAVDIEELARMAVDYVSQGSAAEVIKRNMLKCKELPLAAQVHDELLFGGRVELPDLSQCGELTFPYEIKYLEKWE